ncbi:hypothetical protein CAP35_12990 [Chitinophagaceae bacterium IBVUCB1]|nr:hypothetical protein CAP35_12990 [Chitinophagaceae bacterium IBVUCB1]
MIIIFQYNKTLIMHKQFIRLFIIFSFITASCSTNNDKPRPVSTYIYGFKGKIKSWRRISFVGDIDTINGKRTVDTFTFDITDYQCDADGNITKFVMVTFNRDNSTDTITRTYAAEKGKIVREDIFSKNKVTSYFYEWPDEYHYKVFLMMDGKKKLVRSYTLNKEDYSTIRNEETVMYNGTELFSIIDMYPIDSQTIVSKFFNAEDSTTTYYHNKTIARDKHGNPIYVLLINRNKNKVTGEIVFSFVYDE